MAEGFIVRRGGGVLGIKSAIVATGPSGSTVICEGNGKVKTAKETPIGAGRSTWTFVGLDFGPNIKWNIKASRDGKTNIVPVTLDKFEVKYIIFSYESIPVFTYSGKYEVVDDNDRVISDPSTYTGNWKIRFLTSGNFVVTNKRGWDLRADAFLVGAGGRSGSYDAQYGNGGGGGGYTTTKKNFPINENKSYFINIGFDDYDDNKRISSAFGFEAKGGENGSLNYGAIARGGKGGSGGGGYKGDGGSNGSNGMSSAGEGGKGQGTTTREFGEDNGKLYAGGGGGGSYNGIPGKGGAGGGGTEGPGEPNTGGGGGCPKGSHAIWQPGGSGIVVIRNARNQ